MQVIVFVAGLFREIGIFYGSLEGKEKAFLLKEK